MPKEEAARVALVYRGDRGERNSAGVESSRLAPVAAALADAEIAAEAAVYADDMTDEVRDQLLAVDGVLVWVNPVEGSDDRATLDALLREVAAAGVWVSAHPDVILRMGTKEVLYRTRDLGWGSDTALYNTPADFDEAFPLRLAGNGARVLKQNRGNGGIGVWKVELAPGEGTSSTARPDPRTIVRIQSARNRDDVVEEVALGDFMARCHKYFGYSGGEGRIIDQPFQPRITEGLIRCYLVKDEVVGFSRQYPAGLSPFEHNAGGASVPSPERVFGLPAAKTMYGPDEAAFKTLRRNMEDAWVPAMQSLLDVDTPSLPVLWDADFLLGPKTGTGEDKYVLNEINVSAVSPFPEQALPRLAGAVSVALQSGKGVAQHQAD